MIRYNSCIIRWMFREKQLMMIWLRKLRMNKDWAEKNKKMQALIGKEADFREGLDVLFDLRNDLFGRISSIVNTYPAEAFYQKPIAWAE